MEHAMEVQLEKKEIFPDEEQEKILKLPIILTACGSVLHQQDKQARSEQNCPRQNNFN